MDDLFSAGKPNPKKHTHGTSGGRPRGRSAARVVGAVRGLPAANDDPATLELLGRHVQVPWNRNPTEFRAFAESYYVSAQPLLIKAGLAKG